MRRIILCDLDGTLADCTHRLHYLHKQPKDWTAFFAASGDDEPITHVINLMNALYSRFEIWITSARSDECREITEDWLAENKVKYSKLIMRKSGDHMDDHILKPLWLEDGTIPKERVLCVFDDRTRIVQAWRKLGVTCLQVADGDF